MVSNFGLSSKFGLRLKGLRWKFSITSYFGRTFGFRTKSYTLVLVKNKPTRCESSEGNTRDIY